MKCHSRNPFHIPLDTFGPAFIELFHLYSPSVHFPVHFISLSIHIQVFSIIIIFSSSIHGENRVRDQDSSSQNLCVNTAIDRSSGVLLLKKKNGFV